jgi:hypothetical protein
MVELQRQRGPLDPVPAMRVTILQVRDILPPDAVE